MTAVAGLLARPFRAGCQNCRPVDPGRCPGLGWVAPSGLVNVQSTGAERLRSAGLWAPSREQDSASEYRFPGFWNSAQCDGARGGHGLERSGGTRHPDEHPRADGTGDSQYRARYRRHLFRLVLDDGSDGAGNHISPPAPAGVRAPSTPSREWETESRKSGQFGG